MMCKISLKDLITLTTMPNFQVLKIRQKLKNGLGAPIFGMQGTTTYMQVCTTFEANPLKDVQNFPRKPQNMVKYACFPTFKNSPKIEK